MSSNTLTTEQVLGGLEIDSSWHCLPETVKTTLTPFVAQTPTVLSEYLPKPMTVRNWAETKLAFLQHLLNYGYAEALCDCDTQAEQGSNYVLAVNQAVQNNIAVLQMVLDGLEDLMETSGQTDREILTGPSIGLSGLALQLFDMHRLTIADVLKLQPTLILKTG